MNKKISAFTGFILAFAFILLQLNQILVAMNSISIACAAENIVTKRVYLTFDDGPSDRVTPLILDILDEENVKATFFIIGKQAETRKYLIKREHESGHTVAVHSYSHIYGSIYSSPKTLSDDIDKCNDIIYEVCGKKSNLYRFPGGSYGISQNLINEVNKKGMRYVDWNASVCDAEIINPNPKQLLNAAINTSAGKNNVVLLLHDSTTKKATAQALKAIISYYRSQGYYFDKL